MKEVEVCSSCGKGEECLVGGFWEEVIDYFLFSFFIYIVFNQ